MGRIANDNSGIDDDRSVPDRDIIQPFQLEASGLRGRIVRLGPVLDEILSAHDYPLAVAKLLAETASLALVLSSMLKYEGIFTLQTSGNGVIRTMVSDVTSAGDVRAYAGFDGVALAERAAAALAAGSDGVYDGLTLRQLVGDGYLAFTVDQGPDVERYQGIVSLEGNVLADAVQRYFDQSEQIGTTLKVAAKYHIGQGWQAGAIMLQRMPEAGEAVRGVVPINPLAIEDAKEDWQRSRVLLQSCTPGELTNTELHSHDLLIRLFHEEGVRIYEPTSVQKGCRCSTAKLQNVLASLSDEDRAHATLENGTIEITCAFCSKNFVFSPETLEPVSE